MISRSTLLQLVLGLLLLVVAFAVLMAFQLLIAALGDEAAARAVLWIAVGCLLLLAINFVLLVVAVAVYLIGSPVAETDRESPEG